MSADKQLNEQIRKAFGFKDADEIESLRAQISDLSLLLKEAGEALGPFSPTMDVCKYYDPELPTVIRIVETSGETLWPGPKISDYARARSVLQKIKELGV